MKDGEGYGVSLFENISLEVLRKTINLMKAPVEI
jgi:hypothetical protein